MRSLTLLMMVVVVLGCGSSRTRTDGGGVDAGVVDGGTDAGSGLDAANDSGPPVDGGPVACDEPDRSCPATKPYEGGPCEGTLVCPYPGTDESWSYSCVDGGWQGELTSCMLLGGGCIPPLVEMCTDRFAGTLAGATVEVGPPGGAFRPFTDGETVPLVFGGQGLPMIEYRVRVGHAGPPACALTTTTITRTGGSGSPVREDIRYRCGRTLRIFVIYPFECPLTPQPIDLTVDLMGVGSVTAHVVATAESCPRCPL